MILVENLSVPFDRRVWQECQSLSRAGYDVTVICPRGDGRDARLFEVVEGVAIHRYPLRPATGGIKGYAREYSTAAAHTWRLVRHVSRSRSFTVVHACNPPDFLLATALQQRRLGAAFIFDHHDLVPELYQSRFARPQDLGYHAAKYAERLAFRLAHVVISTNESYRRTAIERGRLDPENVFVVRSAPDLTHFHRVSAVPHLRLGHKYLLAYVGVMGPQDGVDHALRALAALRRRRQDWCAVFVGSGDMLPDMRALSGALGLDDVVRFMGRVSDTELLEVLSTACVGLSPDPKNPLNDVSTMNKIMEYMAVGLPVVSYDLVEARESAGEAAVYATPNNPEAMATKIDELLSASERRERMSRIGLERLSDDLSWAHSEAILLQAYERAIERCTTKRAGKGRRSPVGATQ